MMRSDRGAGMVEARSDCCWRRMATDGDRYLLMYSASWPSSSGGVRGRSPYIYPKAGVTSLSTVKKDAHKTPAIACLYSLIAFHQCVCPCDCLASMLALRCQLYTKTCDFTRFSACNPLEGTGRLLPSSEVLRWRPRIAPPCFATSPHFYCGEKAFPNLHSRFFSPGSRVCSLPSSLYLLAALVSEL